MVTTRGRAEVRQFIGNLPQEIDTKLLRGAARAGARVIAAEARTRCISSEVRSSIKVATKDEDGRMVGKVQTKGRGAYIAPWLEYGTSPHFISVDESQRGGMSVGKLNRLAKGDGSNHSLVIGGKFVGATVLHPGARPHPFMRPALDTKEVEAVKAAQAFIDRRVSRAGIASGPDGGDDA